MEDGRANESGIQNHPIRQTAHLLSSSQRTPTSLLQPKRCVVVPSFSFGLQHNTNTCFACIVINNTKVTLFEYTHKESSSDYPELRRTCAVAKGGAILKSYETN